MELRGHAAMAKNPVGSSVSSPPRLDGSTTRTQNGGDVQSFAGQEAPRNKSDRSPRKCFVIDLKNR